MLIDRRRLKRRLLFWRLATIVAVVVVAVLVAKPALNRDHVARLTVDGVISDTSKMVKALDRMAKDDSAKALVLQISSPGGGVYPSEELHDAVARVAAKKPVVVVMGSVAASGGFMIAMPAQRIFAGPATLTGSIGVLLETQEISGLLDKVGITSEALVSGPLKDQPSLTHKLSDAGRTALQGLITDMYDQFVNIVATGRHMDPAKVRAIADGRVFTGRQALEIGLVDAMGNETDARAWLASTQHVPASLPITDLRTTSGVRAMLADSLAPFLSDTLKSVLYQGVVLDGAQAVWQPSLAK
jgi:protease-4